MAPKRVYVIMTEGDAIRGSEIWCQSFPFRRTDWQRENAIIEDQFEMTSGRFEDLTNHLKSRFVIDQYMFNEFWQIKHGQI
jgi:hypothetical protein